LEKVLVAAKSLRWGKRHHHLGRRFRWKFEATLSTIGCIEKAKEGKMATIVPKGEKVRRAVKWISGERTEDESKPMKKLIEQASLRFNLSPKEELELTHLYQEKA
jgi:hypothetical protein